MLPPVGWCFYLLLFSARPAVTFRREEFFSRAGENDGACGFWQKTNPSGASAGRETDARVMRLRARTGSAWRAGAALRP